MQVHAARTHIRRKLFADEEAIETLLYRAYEVLFVPPEAIR